MIVFELLEKAEHYGKATNFEKCLRQIQRFNKRPAVCMIISDFFAPDYAVALGKLRASKHDISCIQVLSPSELKCDWRGDLRLQCVESGEIKTLTVTTKDAEEYDKLIRQWNEQLRVECLKKNIQYIQTNTEIPFEELVQHILRREGIVS